MARSTSPNASAQLVTAAVAAAAAVWTNSTRVCVAFSGGSDSTVLLHALATERQRSDGAWTLAAHHVHHGISANADAWAAHCAAFCTSLGVDFSVQRVSINQHAGLGLEAAARDARIASLDRVEADWIVFAHHAQDQAETLLLQLLRGSGPPGMAAMPQSSSTHRSLRPLLSVPKAALLDYARIHALCCVTDESNADNRFSRNRLRNTVWPRLVEAFPAAEATLNRAAQHQADAAELLNDLAAIDAATCVAEDTIRLSDFNALTPPRRANLLRFWLHAHHTKPPATDTLREWLQQLSTAAGIQSVELRGSGHDWVIRVYRGRAHLTQDAPHWNPCVWHGETTLTLGAAGAVQFLRDTHGTALRDQKPGERWGVRMRQHGDGVRLSERSGHVALKNIFQQANIPPWLRTTWPLIVCDDEVVAVASVATAKAFTVTEGDLGRRCEWKPASPHLPGS
jgi:tRNA(Ile)-lysidine synthase